MFLIHREIQRFEADFAPAGWERFYEIRHFNFGVYVLGCVPFKGSAAIIADGVLIG
jgi:hypothetical protein